MDVKERVRMAVLMEKLRKDPELAQKLIEKDKSYFVKNGKAGYRLWES